MRNTSFATTHVSDGVGLETWSSVITCLVHWTNRRCSALDYHACEQGGHLLLLGDEQVHLIHQQHSHALAICFAVLREHPFQVFSRCRWRRVLACQRLQSLRHSVTDEVAALRGHHLWVPCARSWC